MNLFEWIFVIGIGLIILYIVAVIIVKKMYK